MKPKISNFEITSLDYVNKFIIINPFCQNIKNIFFGIFSKIFSKHTPNYSHNILGYF
jgi:hypothetical protein